MTNPIPADLKYTNSHEWVRVESDDTVTLGITVHAQELLGDIVFVELPEQHKTFHNGEACAVVESVKAAADVYCPLAGEVIAINEVLTSKPELVNSDPYGEGWLCRLRLTNPADLASLLSAEGYKRNIENEEI